MEFYRHEVPLISTIHLIISPFLLEKQMKITGVSQVSHMAICVKLCRITHFTSLCQTERVMLGKVLSENLINIFVRTFCSVLHYKEGPIILAEIR